MALNDMLKSLSDEEVVERVQAGETALYEILMRRYNQRVYRVARSILRDESEAEDVMQDAYVRAYRNLDRFEGRARFSTWLTRIAIHEALARKRRRARLVSIDTEETPMAPITTGNESPEDFTGRRELGNLLAQAVDHLPESLRLVYVLREVEDLSTEEVAAALDLSESNVKVRLHRARRSLRRTFEAAMDGSIQDLYGFHLRRCDRVVERVFARLGVRAPGEVT